MNITQEMLEKISEAWDNLESPCRYCAYREGHHCKAFDAPIAEDSLDVFIPADACEESMADRV